MNIYNLYLFTTQGDFSVRYFTLKEDNVFLVIDQTYSVADQKIMILLVD